MTGARTTGRTGPKPRGERLRRDLVDVGRRTLERYGIDNLSLRSLAADLGISAAAPGYHFGNKEGLLAEVALAGYADLIAQRRAIEATDRTDLVKLGEMMIGYVRFALDNPETFKLMFGTRIEDKYSYPGVFDCALTSLTLFSRPIIAIAAERGWPPDLVPYLTHAGWAVEHGVACLLLARQFPLRTMPVDPLRMAEFSVATLLATLEAGPAGLLETRSAGCLSASAATLEDALRNFG